MGGRKSQAFGDLFEKLFFKQCRAQQIAVTRIPDGCKQLSKRLIRVKTPWDFVISYKGRSAFIDTKTTLAEAFAYSAIDKDQLANLSAHADCGAISGYIVWFRKNDRVRFVPAREMLKTVGLRGSFSDNDQRGTLLGNSLTFDVQILFSKGI